MIFNLNEKWYRSDDDVTAPAEAPTTARCEGGACGDVTVDLAADGYEVSNHGCRRVRVSLCYLLGADCTGWSHVELEPGESKQTSNRGYCIPYRASYL